MKNIFKNIINLADKFITKYSTKLIDKVHLLDPKDNTKQRVLSSIILIPIALYAILASQNLFIFLAICIAVLMTFEWVDITKSAVDKKKWRIIGFFYIAIPIYSVIQIRVFDEDILFWMFAIIWSTDIFAFFTGRIIGGKKIAPLISPNKTWSGLIGGVAASMLVGFIVSLMFSGGFIFFVVASAFISVLEQLSDLMESKIKRIFGVKDSGNIIPGHGGVLDRLDGLTLVAPFILLLMTIFSSQFGL